MGHGVSELLEEPATANPSIKAIEAKNRAEAARALAEKDAQAAREEVERIQREAEAERQRAEALQEEANRAADKAHEEKRKMMAEIAEAQRRVEQVTAEAEVAASVAHEDAARFAQQAAEERERARQVEEQARLAEATARAEAAKAQKAAEEECRKADAVRVEAERTAKVAEEETRRAIATKEEVERQWKNGIQPVVTPTMEQLEETKRNIQYKEGMFHFAIAGVAGSGKSSLINALRGLRNRQSDRGAAATGVTETTLIVGRYPDPKHPFVWYDIPGAGTQKIPDWQYFNEQGLYVFDAILVLFDNRFTNTDIAILTNARRFNIPTYIVRSKADQHIWNLMKEMENDSDEEGDQDPGHRNTEAREKFIEATRENVQANLENANLPDQRVYIVSNDTMSNVVRGKNPEVIDEVELLTDLLIQAHARRKADDPQ
ncbi:interferon-inducible GTPase-domain-containing protein [Scleroderma yunnanense]